ncbi:hypothetical protein EsDP_00000442 [Epichloe bromicola]|uniref:INO80 complex subunit B-like conserved region domain-containing protein n=1 Tax=Epichloe bromicola TaxID=79588 RepID=A0ABQ0CEX7_9HYPO
MPSSSPDEIVTVQTSRSTRGANRRNERSDAAEIVHGTRNRGGRKNYVIDSSPDDDDDEDAEADGVGEADEDAEGDGMEVDAEGDVDMDASITSGAGHTIRVSQPAPRSAAKAAAAKIAVDEEDEEDEDDEDDEDDLSDPADSDDGDQTIGFGDETMADEDAEGEEIEVAGEEDEEDEEEDEEEDDDVDADVDADADADADLEGEGEGEGEGEVGIGGVAAEVNGDEGSQEEYPDLTKMTKRQRARFEDEPQEYMKLSDEVQVKKHFTAEELSMRRQEMARRRRNLSEKRTEEVKMETINKLLKKQAPKVNRKAAAAAARGESPDEGEHKSNSTLIRWINNKNGSNVSVPEDILSGPAGQVFSRGGGLSSGKMVEEVS